MGEQGKGGFTCRSITYGQRWMCGVVPIMRRGALGPTDRRGAVRVLSNPPDSLHCCHSAAACCWRRCPLLYLPLPVLLLLLVPVAAAVAVVVVAVTAAVVVVVAVVAGAVVAFFGHSWAQTVPRFHQTSSF